MVAEVFVVDGPPVSAILGTVADLSANLAMQVPREQELVSSSKKPADGLLAAHSCRRRVKIDRNSSWAWREACFNLAFTCRAAARLE